MTVKVIAANRKAYHDYHVLDAIEAGIALTGTEIKSIRAGAVNLREAYARIEDGQAWLYNVHVSRYDPGNRFNHEPTRARRLLLHRKEIQELHRRMLEKGLTLVPLRLYLKEGLAKVELGLVRGKKQYDKREAEARREAEREMARAVRREVATAAR
ncbi:MAG: SsrA-binding protein SmpB [Chloroflexi bacterium]|nr:SsrA-binding protein SmpB [Chloroflexota bacterium]